MLRGRYPTIDIHFALVWWNTWPPEPFFDSDWSIFKMFSYEITMQNNLKLCRNVLYEVFYKRSIFGSGWTNKLGRQRSQQIYFMVHLLYDWLNHTIATIGARILCRTHVLSHSIICNGNIILYRIEIPWIIPLYLWILFFFLSIKWLFPSVHCWMHVHDIV